MEKRSFSGGTTATFVLFLQVLIGQCDGFVVKPSSQAPPNVYQHMRSRIHLTPDTTHQRRKSLSLRMDDEQKSISETRKDLESRNFSFLGGPANSSFASSLVLENFGNVEDDLRNEIESLRRQLKDVEQARDKFRELGELMKEEKEMLEQQLEELRTAYKADADHKLLYEEEQKTRLEQEAKYQKEIDRLEKEVRVVFSIGRRTSDKMVETLNTKLSAKEETLRMTIHDMTMKDDYIRELEEERQSLRHLGRLSWKLTSERLSQRMLGWRKAIFSLTLRRNREITANGERPTVPVRKSRRS